MKEYDYEIGEEVFATNVNGSEWHRGTIVNRCMTSGSWGATLPEYHILENGDEKGRLYKCIRGAVVSVKERNEAIMRREELLKKATKDYGDSDINEGLLLLADKMTAKIGPSRISMLANSIGHTMTHGVD